MNIHILEPYLNRMIEYGGVMTLNSSEIKPKEFIDAMLLGKKQWNENNKEHSK